MGADTVAKEQKFDSLRAALPDKRVESDSSQNLQGSPGVDGISCFGDVTNVTSSICSIQSMSNAERDVLQGLLLAWRRSRLSRETHITNVYYHGLIMAQLCECSTETGKILYLEANDSQDRSLMSGQPGLRCLEVSPAPRAVSEPCPRQTMGQVSRAQDSFIQHLICQLRIVRGISFSTFFSCFWSKPWK